MSLDTIKLPPIVIQQLFSRSLIDYKKQEAPEEKTVSKRFAVLGNNRRQIIILVDNDETLYLVRETKGTKDFLKLRTSEADKVRCGQKHFDTLGVPFSVVVSADEV